MKHKLLMLSSLLILCACTASAQNPEPEPSPEIILEETDPPTAAVTADPGCLITGEPLVIHFPMRTDTQDVIFELDEQYVTFQIPADCRHEMRCDENSETLTVSKNGEGIISLYHGFFGVCGTGLKEEKGTLAGHPVHYGYYDGEPQWSFISFDDLDFALTRSGPDTNETVIELIIDTMGIWDYPASPQP